jgi:hypothetical protein
MPAGDGFQIEEKNSIRHVISALFVLLLFATFTPPASAPYRSGDENVEVGIFGELFRVNQVDLNLAAV